MPEPTPSPVPEQAHAAIAPAPAPATEAADQEVYRPVSGWAVAGLLLSAFFAVFFLVDATVALLRHIPFLLPTWFLVLPLTGAALSFFARWRIRRSEGTRAGLGLTKWGIGLGVLFGLGYTAYAAATDLAVRRQAEDFLEDPNNGFFAKLKTPGEINAAFLLTRPPDLREGVNPNNTESLEALFKGALTGFWDHNLVRIAQQGGKETQIKLLGVRSPVYQEGGYWVGVDMEITTPHFTVIAPLLVRSQESRTGRQWYVDWSKTPSRLREVRSTKLGDEVQRMRVLSHQFATKWVDRLVAGNLKPKDFVPKGDGLDLSAVRSAKMRDAIKKELDQLIDPSASERPYVKADFACCVRTMSRNQQSTQDPLLAYWEVNQRGRLEIPHELRLMFGDPAEKRGKFACVAKVVVERTDKDAATLKYDEKRPPTWRIVRLEITRAQKAAQGPRGGPRIPG
jgi:hypothetical protein